MIHITDEPMVDPCCFVDDQVAGEVTLVFQRQALLADPEAAVLALQTHWNTIADRYRAVVDETPLRSAG